MREQLRYCRKNSEKLCALTRLPFHTVRSKFDIPHENQDFFAPVIHFYKSECSDVTLHGNNGTGVDGHKSD